MQRIASFVLLALMASSCAATINGERSAGTMASAPVVAATATSAGTAPNIEGKVEPLTIHVTPLVVAAPAHVSVRMRVEPDARSRSLSIEWWSGDGSGGSHLISLQGRQAAARHEYAIQHMDAGEYEVTAVLTRDDGTEVRRRTTVHVIGREGAQAD